MPGFLDGGQRLAQRCSGLLTLLHLLEHFVVTRFDAEVDPSTATFGERLDQLLVGLALAATARQRVDARAARPDDVEVPTLHLARDADGALAVAQHERIEPVDLADAERDAVFHLGDDLLDAASVPPAVSHATERAGVGASDLAHPDGEAASLRDVRVVEMVREDAAVRHRELAERDPRTAERVLQLAALPEEQVGDLLVTPTVFERVQKLGQHEMAFPSDEEVEAAVLHQLVRVRLGFIPADDLRNPESGVKRFGPGQHVANRLRRVSRIPNQVGAPLLDFARDLVAAFSRRRSVPEPDVPASGLGALRDPAESDVREETELVVDGRQVLVEGLRVEGRIHERELHDFTSSRSRCTRAPTNAQNAKWKD